MRPPLEVAHIFRQHGDDFRLTHSLLPEQRRVMRAIERCRTAALGGHVEQCDACGHQRIAYNSCRNRHCPKCQSLAKARWLQARLAEQEAFFVSFFGREDSSPLSKFLAFDQRFQLEFSQLFRVDRMFMAHGIEARVPYLYEPVASAANNLPDHDKIVASPPGRFARWLRGYQPQEKIALRKMSSRILPRAIAQRPKFGAAGTANLHESAAAHSISTFFRSALTDQGYAAARESMDELFDWKRIEEHGSRIPSKLRLFLGLLVGTRAHSLNRFQWQGGDVHQGTSATVVTNHHQRKAA